jgi:2',3'-cyclic-nucleotide 2'-phosphodiesterase (5'-nucleotidase family)
MRDPFDVASEMIPKLRAEADLVVLISHMGYDKDKLMARDLSGIDIIVGAHSHTRLPVGDYEYAGRAKRGHPQGTVITQAHCWGGELGRLDFTAQPGPDGKWRVAQYTAGLLMVDDKIKEDKAVADVIARYWNPIKAKYGEVIGESADEFVEADDADPTNYYLMCDAIHAGVPGAQFELENFGGVRAPILKGTITRSDLIEVDPFTNTIVTFGIKGADLKKLLGYTRPATSKSLRYSRKPRPAPTARRTGPSATAR